MARQSIEWSGAEIRILREHYPSGGVRTCAPQLPGRTKGAIYEAAYDLGLRRHGRKPGSGRPR